VRGANPERTWRSARASPAESHSVRLALEVTHGHELEAAIEALRRICRRSPRLAQMVFERLCAKVDRTLA